MIDFEAYSPLLLSHLETTHGDRFFHYTSAESLIGVLSNKEVWASHTQFLNDSSEVKHGIQMTQELIAQRLVGEQHPDAKSFLEQTSVALRQSTAFKKQAYVISFTELDDSLSQWRGYCPASGGYMIGLPTAQIADMAREQGFKLVKCIYGSQLQRDILNEIISTGIIAFKKNIEEGDGPDQFIDNQDAFFDYLLTVCSTMKDSSFDEEHEWRLILLRSEVSDQQLFFRSGNKGVIPFCKFRLSNAEYPNLIERDGVKFMVRIGPSPNREERGLAVCMMLKHYLELEAEPVFSNVPYQTW